MSDNLRDQNTFLGLYLQGKALADDIDDYVEQWHRNPGKVTIYEYLGMSQEEYALWVYEPEILPHIALARRTGTDLRTVVRQAKEGWPIAARSADDGTVRRLLNWLSRRGLDA